MYLNFSKKNAHLCAQTAPWEHKTLPQKTSTQIIFQKYSSTILKKNCRFPSKKTNAHPCARLAPWRAYWWRHQSRRSCSHPPPLIRGGGSRPPPPRPGWNTRPALCRRASSARCLRLREIIIIKLYWQFKYIVSGGANRTSLSPGVNRTPPL